MSALPTTIAQAARALRDGTTTSAQLTAAAIERADALDGRLGVFVTRFAAEAAASARAADDALAAGEDRGPLHGIPLGIKDIIAAAEGPTTAGSLVLDPAWGAGRDATAIARLRAAGAVIVGKTTTMEFAFGPPDPAKPFPLPRNPWDDQTWPGGSSSGTGSGVAAGCFLGGLGTDTGGSIRLPAAFCGVTGLMPTFGRVPGAGVAPLGYSLDRVGPIARTAEDCMLLLAAISGYDDSDPYAAARPPLEPLAKTVASLAGMRVGVARAAFEAPAGFQPDPLLAPVFDAALTALAGLGAELVEVELPLYEEMIAVDLVTLGAECFAYHHPDLIDRWEDFGVHTRAMIAAGALISGGDYVQAQRVRRVGQRAIARLFDEVDVIAAPTALCGALAYDGEQPPSLEQIFGSPCTHYWNPFGNPAIALPMGWTGDGLPLSLQLAGRPFDETTLVAAGIAYQSATDWHSQLPPALDALTGAAELRDGGAHT
jgi:aspartyl-tRNA(Asn)/glutamyl-tRNA(Gln) amidotransferase subunit A